MDRVPVDLPDVKILLDLSYVLPADAVGDAPDPVGRRGMVVCQLFPEGSLDQRDNAARRVWRPAVVLAFVGGRSWLAHSAFVHNLIPDRDELRGRETRGECR